MTAERFKLARYLLETKDWDLFTMVEMGSDRLHHAFWRFWDKTHPKYEPELAVLRYDAELLPRP